MQETLHPHLIYCLEILVLTLLLYQKQDFLQVQLRTYSFTIQGKSSTTSEITATITSTTDLTAIKDAINAVSGSTGVTAALTSDKSGINITQSEGYDIIIGDLSTGSTNADLHVTAMDMDGVLDTTEVTVDTSAPP